MRRTIRNDILFFGIPALVVFAAGLVVSARDGYSGLTSTFWRLLAQPEGAPPLSAWNVAGVVVFALGLSLAIAAAFTLGRFYLSTLMIRSGHELVTRGVYRYVRHPIYLGVLIAIMGIPLSAPSLSGFMVLSLLIPIFLFRIKMEEEMLGNHFGSEYDAYRKRTKKLIPFVY